MFCVELFSAFVERRASCVWSCRPRGGVGCGLHGEGMDVVMRTDVCCNQAVDEKEVGSK